MSRLDKIFADSTMAIRYPRVTKVIKQEVKLLMINVVDETGLTAKDAEAVKANIRAL